MLPGAVLFTAGALAVLSLPALPPWHWLALAAVPALLPWRGRALYAAAVLGALLAAHRAQSLLEDRWPLAQSDAEAWVQGRIASLPERRLSPGQDRDSPGEDADSDSASQTPAYDWRFLFVPDGAQHPRRIRVSWYRSEEALKGADCWQLKLRLRAPHGDLNPGGFDYEQWLFEQGIGATATVREGRRCADSSGYRLLHLRQAIVERLEEWLPGNRGLPMVAGLAAGDRSLLGEQDWDSFRITGTTHSRAIAGLHIGMVSAAVYFLLRWLWVLPPGLSLWLPAQRAALLGATLAATVYALLSGFEPPAQRALLMLLAGFAALWSERPSLAPRALALAWLLIVAADPVALLSPGLWLSFTAVAAIFYAVGGRIQAGPAWQQFLRMQLALSVALLPLTFYFFQGGGWIGPLANLAVVPLFTVLLPALLLALVAAWLAPGFGVPALSLVAHAIYAVRAGLGWAAAHAPAAWVAASPQPALLLLAFLGVFALLAPRGLPLRLFGVLCLLPLLLPMERGPRSGFQLAALDVGQGLSVVVRTARHALLFDTGPAYQDYSDAGRSEVVPYLLSQGLHRLDLMIVSHADLDHRGGAPSVRRELTVDSELGALAVTPCIQGQHWSWDGVDFEILNPGPPEEEAAPGRRARPHSERWLRNNQGCVLRIAAGGHAALLPADIEAPAEKRLLAEEAGKLRADVLLVPHHGSKTSSTEDFAAAVAPSLAIFPAGWHNRFHFPRAEVVQRYLDHGAQERMTGNEGTVSVSVGAQGLSDIGAYRSDHPRLWREPSEPVPVDNP